MRNLFDDLPAQPGDAEATETFASCPVGRVERIVSRGHASPPDFWYDQSEHEWVTVLKGRARLRFERGAHVMEMEPGDHVWIPAGERHRVDWTDPDQDTIWLAVFFVSE